MSDVTELLDAVAQLGTGSGLNRARASVTAMQTIMRMSPDDKRAVALLVAERVAPQLVERIEAGTGQDLSKAQVETVVQLLQKLDGDDLRELRDTVTDAEQRGVALRQVSRAAATSAAVATGLEELATPTEVDDEADADVDPDQPPPPATPPATVAEVETGDPPGVGGEADDADTGTPGPDVDTPHEDDAVAAAKAAADEELAQLERDAAAMKAEARRAQLDAQAEIERLAADQTAATVAAAATATTGDVPTPAVTEDENLFDDLPTFDLDARTAARVPDDAGRRAAARRATPRRLDPAHADRIRGASTTAAALAALRTAVDESDDDVETLLALARLVPDGWGRRRAIEELLRRDLLHGEDAADALRCLGGAGDRRFVAGAVLADRHATAAQLRGAVDDRTLDRLARRTAVSGRRSGTLAPRDRQG